MSAVSAKDARERARSLFASHYARFRDYRAAARAAGVSERTGRRWRQDVSILASLDRAQDAIGQELTSFVGREADLEALGALFDGGARLVTVAGPPGIGKTRLGLRYSQLRLRDGGAASFCDVREAQGGEDLCAALSQLFGVQLSEGIGLAEYVEPIGRALDANGACLIVLDNFEQLVAAAPQTLHRWLRMAPRSRFLVTSRRVLRLRGEHVHELGPLVLPGADDDGACEAMQLFYRRAQSVEPRFEQDASRTQAVAELVRCLEGIPLAIELAAGQMRRATPETLLEKLRQRVIELASDRRDADRRHATLRAAIDGSWELLEPWEREALCRLSTFRGGFTLGAAEAVLALPECAKAPPVADIVATLRETSLLRVDGGGEASEGLRWAMYQAIREYASERLVNLVDASEASARHARYYLARGERCAAEIAESGAQSARNWLVTELDNLRAAHDWLSTHPNSAGKESVDRMALVLHAGTHKWMPAFAAAAISRAIAISGETLASREKSVLQGRLRLARAENSLSLGRYDQAERDLVGAATLLEGHPALSAELGPCGWPSPDETR